MKDNTIPLSVFSGETNIQDGDWLPGHILELFRNSHDGYTLKELRRHLAKLNIKTSPMGAYQMIANINRKKGTYLIVNVRELRDGQAIFKHKEVAYDT